MPTTVIQYFRCDHLPDHLRSVAEQIAALAYNLESRLPDGPEKSAGMRKLLEAKDCFVRTLVSSPSAVELPQPKFYLVAYGESDFPRVETANDEAGVRAAFARLLYHDASGHDDELDEYMTHFKDEDNWSTDGVYVIAFEIGRICVYQTRK